VLVIGGSGDYFDVADHVISMKEYVPEDCTADAKAIAEKYRTEREREGGEAFGQFSGRMPVKESFDPSRGKRDVKISPKGLLSIVFGRHDIDLGAVEQLVDVSQTRAMGEAIHYAARYMNNERTLKDVIDLVISDLDTSGLDVLNKNKFGDYAVFRSYELASAINRLRTIKVVQKA
jgi:predicted ABC-class ATPase